MKFFLLLFILFATVNETKAQVVFCPPGAIWHYAVNGYWSNLDGVIEYLYTNDTVVNSLTCKNIWGTYFGARPAYSITYTVIPNYKSYITYENNNVLYLYNGNSFDTVVNYNAAIGDKWLRLRTVSGFTCNSRRALTVTDTGHVLINGFNRKKIVTSYTSSVLFSSQIHTFALTNTFVAGVYNSLGSNNDGNDMFPLYCEVDNTIVEYPQTNFRCYRNNNFPVYNVSSYDCKSLTAISENALSKYKIVVSPNPTLGKITIQLSDYKDLNIRISNSLGQLVYVNKIISQENELDLGFLSPGVYYMAVQSNAEQRVIKLIKE